jgi:hypothetical protein
VVKQLEGHNYGLEILMSIAKGHWQNQAPEGATVFPEDEENQSATVDS